MARSDRKPIVIVKRRSAPQHGGHSGGSWKIAYADFATAMMAFFIVMWVLGMDQNVRNSVEGYFANPVGFKKGYTAGASPLSFGRSTSTPGTPATLVSRRQETERLGSTGERIRSRLKAAGLTAIGDRIEIVETSTGLRIELSESESGHDFFEVASSSMTPAMRTTLQIVAQELTPLANPIIIEGHTDALQYAGLYTNWELSADRANAARRVLEQGGLPPERVIEVRGMADRQLRNPQNPLDPRNRRITIFLPFMTHPDGDSTAARVDDG